MKETLEKISNGMEDGFDEMEKELARLMLEAIS